MNGRAALELDLVIVACAVSAGIHAALAPGHLDDETAAGVGFWASAALLAVLAVVLTRRPSAPALGATVALLAGLLGAYVAAVTTGLPFLHPEPEPIDAIALFTKVVELAALVAATDLLLARPKGALA